MEEHTDLLFPGILLNQNMSSCTKVTLGPSESLFVSSVVYYIFLDTNDNFRANKRYGECITSNHRKTGVNVGLSIFVA